MFYFIAPSITSYNIILTAAAVLPAVFLMMKVYRSDKLEQEPPAMLWRLMIAGVLSSLLALVEEKVGMAILDHTVKDYKTYMILLYFGVVAYAEETSKYLLLKRSTWRSDSFNCQYDGVVYAVFVSLGFALWENISYVMTYGFGTALIRAITAIPGHACFGVFMGVFYGIAKKVDNAGRHEMSKVYRVLSVVLPAALHGAYDYIASSPSGSTGFIIFIVILFAFSYLLIDRMSKQDRYI